MFDKSFSLRDLLVDSLKSTKAQNIFSTFTNTPSEVNAVQNVSRFFEGKFPSDADEKKLYEKFKTHMSSNNSNTEEEKLNQYVTQNTIAFSDALFTDDKQDFRPEIIQAIGEKTYDKLEKKIGKKELMAQFLIEAITYNSQIIMNQNSKFLLETQPAKTKLITLTHKPNDYEKGTFWDIAPSFALHERNLYYITRMEGDKQTRNARIDLVKNADVKMLTQLFPKALDVSSDASDTDIKKIKTCLNPTCNILNLNEEGEAANLKMNNLNIKMGKLASEIGNESITKLQNPLYQQLVTVNLSLEKVIADLDALLKTYSKDDPRRSTLDAAIDELKVANTNIITSLTQELKLGENTSLTPENVLALKNKVTSILKEEILAKPELHQVHGLVEKFIKFITEIFSTYESKAQKAVTPVLTALSKAQDSLINSNNTESLDEGVELTKRPGNP